MHINSNTCLHLQGNTNETRQDTWHQVLREGDSDTHQKEAGSQTIREA